MANKAGRRTFGASSQLPSGRWRARYYGPDGIYYSADRTFVSKQDAWGWLGEVERSISLGTWKSPTQVKEEEEERRRRQEEVEYTLEEYADLFFARGGRKPRTDEEYRRYFDRHIRPTFGDVPLGKITALKVGNWYARLCPTAPTERAHTYAFLRTLLLNAKREQLITESPCNIPGAGVHKRASVTVLPTDVEILLAVSFMPDRYRLAVQLAAASGLRNGEIRGLKRADIDLAHGLITVRRNIARYDGGEHEGSTKSTYSSRRVPISRDMITDVEEHLSEHVGPRDDALLFPSVRGELLPVGSLWNYWDKARTQAGCPDLRFHDLRHYAATMFVVKGGASEYEAIRLLGQNDSRVLRKYLDEISGRNHEIINSLPSLALRREPIEMSTP
ncbi:MAG: site-specific integrase [Propionibacteriaceae bacterium]|nr:site-specific integrase [Propionibacteriaceae bacterium]